MKKRKLIAFGLAAAFIGSMAVIDSAGTLPLFGILPAKAQTYDEATSALINPPNSSVTFTVGANQNVTLYQRNNNILGVATTVTGEVADDMTSTWSTVILPLSEVSKGYSKFAPVPVGYSWTVSTISDAANVGLRARWLRW